VQRNVARGFLGNVVPDAGKTQRATREPENIRIKEVAPPNTVLVGRPMVVLFHREEATEDVHEHGMDIQCRDEFLFVALDWIPFLDSIRNMNVRHGMQDVPGPRIETSGPLLFLYYLILPVLSEANNDGVLQLSGFFEAVKRHFL